LFGRNSIKTHPEWLALVAGFRLNDVKLDVCETLTVGIQDLCMAYLDLTQQNFSLSNGRTVVIEFNDCRITHPDQVIRCLNFNVSTLHFHLVATLKAALAVLGMHLVRYLHGVGHPPGCEDVVESLSASIRDELMLIDPSVLRAQLLLRAISDHEYIPMEIMFSLDVSRTLNNI
jgi:hypothetical protein